MTPEYWYALTLKRFEKYARSDLIVAMKKMVKDLNINSEVIVVPTIRENDGLAMSSRNKYLSPEGIIITIITIIITINSTVIHQLLLSL